MSNPEKLSLFIVTSSIANNLDYVEVHPWNTVKEVKDAIQTSVSPDHLTLMFNGKTLHDKCKISDYGVQQYSELVLHIEEAIKEWPVRQKRKIESPHGPGEGMKIAEHETQIEHTQDRHSEGDFKAYEVTRDPDEKQDPLELMWKRLCRTQQQTQSEKIQYAALEAASSELLTSDTLVLELNPQIPQTIVSEREDVSGAKKPDIRNITEEMRKASQEVDRASEEKAKAKSEVQAALKRIRIASAKMMRASESMAKASDRMKAYLALENGAE